MTIAVGENEAVHLDVSHVTYTVKERLGGWYQGCCLREKVEKVVLDDVSLRASGGEVTALLGNSGKSPAGLMAYCPLWCVTLL